MLIDIFIHQHFWVFLLLVQCYAACFVSGIPRSSNIFLIKFIPSVHTLQHSLHQKNFACPTEKFGIFQCRLYMVYKETVKIYLPDWQFYLSRTFQHWHMSSPDLLLFVVIWNKLILPISFGPGIILGVGSANERRHYNVMSSLIGWAHTQNDHCGPGPIYGSLDMIVAYELPKTITWTSDDLLLIRP